MMMMIEMIVKPCCLESLSNSSYFYWGVYLYMRIEKLLFQALNELSYFDICRYNVEKINLFWQDGVIILHGK